MYHFATYPLLNGLTIPRVGFGTSQIPDGEPTAEAVCAAVAEEEGTDISAIRVISFKKL